MIGIYPVCKLHPVPDPCFPVDTVNMVLQEEPLRYIFIFPLN